MKVVDGEKEECFHMNLVQCHDISPHLLKLIRPIMIHDRSQKYLGIEGGVVIFTGAVSTSSRSSIDCNLVEVKMSLQKIIVRV